METIQLEKLKYPIGKFISPALIDQVMINEYIRDIEIFPDQITQEVKSLTNEQLDTHYRPEGWTLRQVVHHCADSHINSFVRFKLALTEHKPTIKPYEEGLWAELPDSKTLAIQSSLDILHGVHKRWVVLLKSFTENEWGKSYVHPEHNKESNLAEVLANYSWHCRHHLAHIIITKQQYNW